MARPRDEVVGVARAADAPSLSAEARDTMAASAEIVDPARTIRAARLRRVDRVRLAGQHADPRRSPRGTAAGARAVACGRHGRPGRARGRAGDGVPRARGRWRSGSPAPRPVVAETMLALLNAGITPVVYEHGSLGASGDLAPLAHAALALIGEGEVWDAAGKRRPAAEVLAEAGIEPPVLTAKEGLALINGTDGILGMLVLALADLDVLVKTADITAAMTVEALLGTDRAFAAELQALRPHAGQARRRRTCGALLAGSPIVASHRYGDTRVQDAYSLRCTPQVHGAARDTVAHAYKTAARWTGSTVACVSTSEVLTSSWREPDAARRQTFTPSLRHRTTSS